MNQEVVKFIQEAIECSVYIAPKEPGLTFDEVLEIGKRIGLQAGEIGDSVQSAAKVFIGGKRMLPTDSAMTLWAIYNPEDPDYRNFAAFDFVVSQLNDRVKAEGARNAQLDRSLVVERAIAQGIPQNDIEVAITMQVMCGQLTEKNGVLRFPQGLGERGLPSATHQIHHRGHVVRKDVRTRLYPHVKDVIERRTDGRPKYAEPLDAFADELDKLGYGAFRLWWKQTVAELRCGDVQSSPVSVSVLAAALVEGALTFVVKHARNRGLGVFQTNEFDRDAKTWKIDDLVRSAASGSDSAILDMQTKNRAETLIRTRHRIHAGRMLSDFPNGVPDIRPEEARDAKATADQVVRRVLDWLQKYPPASAT